MRLTAMHMQTSDTARQEAILSPAQKSFLITKACASIGLFYCFFTGVILGLGLLIALEAILFLGLMRFGLGGFIVNHLKRNLELLLLICRCLWLRSGDDFQIELAREEAPKLCEILDRLSSRLGIPSPKMIRIEMNAGAWVRLEGFSAASKKTVLGLGFDLIAGHTEAELEAVLAHELTHAKLVKRSLSRWLNRGLARAIALTNNLNAARGYLPNNTSSQGVNRLLRVADFCTRLAARQVRAYSRQDEFEADRGAAELCGGAALKSSLLKLDALMATTSRIGWSERVALLNKGGYASWLVSEIVAGQARSVSTTDKEQADPYSTHPTTRDRIAALPSSHLSPDKTAPAILLFADAEAIAQRLVTEIRRVLAKQEARDLSEKRAWLKKMRRNARLQLGQWLALIPCTAGLGILFGIIAEPHNWPLFLGLHVLLLGPGIWLYRSTYYKDRSDLPLPDFARLRTAHELQFPEGEEREARSNTLTQELQEQLEGLRKKSEKLRLLEEEATRALLQSDYHRAFIAAKLGIRLDGLHVGLLLRQAISAAALKSADQASLLLSGLAERTGLRTSATRKGAAWTAYLLGNPGAAEVLLLEENLKAPAQVAVLALLALCEKSQNKHQSALAHAREALSLAPEDPSLITLCVEILLDDGAPAEVDGLLAKLTQSNTEEPSRSLLQVRAKLLRHDFHGADVLPHTLLHPEAPAWWHRLAGEACHAVRRDAEARQHLENALARGFLPEAQLYLAQLDLQEGKRADASRRAAAALNSRLPVADHGIKPGDCLGWALSIFNQCEDALPNQKAFIGRFQGNVCTFLAGRHFLVCARDAEQACRILQSLHSAAQPGTEPENQPKILLEIAPKEQQPDQAVVPGIHNFWT